MDKRKQDGELYQRYLRIYDAKLTGATDGEIAKEIFPEEDNDYDSTGRRVSKKVNDSYQAAKKLVNGDYRYIIKS